MAADLDLTIWAVVGASGTGKGLWVKQRLRELQPVRFVAWDFKDEYSEFGQRVETLAALRAAMLQAGTGPGRFRYVSRGAGDKVLRREFETVCELVYAWEHCVFVAEELANVTTPGWAPPAWRRMTTSGRHAGVHIIGCTQTPALVDKTFLGNATMLHCCSLREAGHRQAVARAMDVPESEIAALVKLQWLERNFDTGQLAAGWVEIPAAGAKPARGKRATPKNAPRARAA